jgi:putative salt-induced outer membrane protein YdiY
MLKLLKLFTILLFSVQLNGQIVNIEAKRVNLSDTTAIYGQLDLNFNLIENGNSIISLGGGANIEFVKKKHWFLALTNFNFFQAGEEDFVNDGFLHFRHNYQINNFLAYESFTQFQYNEKLNLRLRWLLGTGLRFTLLQKKNNDAHFGLSYMYEYNKESMPSMEFRQNRMNSYLSFSFQIFPNARLSNTTYFQPVITDLEDLRLASQAALLINFTKKLLFTSTFNITYDSMVPENVENTFYSFKNGIRWNF